MNSQLLFEKLKNSKEYVEFMKENPDSYLCSGFFVIDLENKETGNQYHFDFYSPEKKGTFSFELEHEGGIKLVPIERYEQDTIICLMQKKFTNCSKKPVLK